MHKSTRHQIIIRKRSTWSRLGFVFKKGCFFLCAGATYHAMRKGIMARGRCHTGPKFHTSCVLARLLSLPVGVPPAANDAKLMPGLSDALIDNNGNPGEAAVTEVSAVKRWEHR